MFIIRVKQSVLLYGFIDGKLQLHDSFKAAQNFFLPITTKSVVSYTFYISIETAFTGWFYILSLIIFNSKNCSFQITDILDKMNIRRRKFAWKRNWCIDFLFWKATEEKVTRDNVQREKAVPLTIEKLGTLNIVNVGYAMWWQ